MARADGQAAQTKLLAAASDRCGPGAGPLPNNTSKNSGHLAWPQRQAAKLMSNIGASISANGGEWQAQPVAGIYFPQDDQPASGTRSGPGSDPSGTVGADLYSKARLKEALVATECPTDCLSGPGAGDRVPPPFLAKKVTRQP